MLFTRRLFILSCPMLLTNGALCAETQNVRRRVILPDDSDVSAYVGVLAWFTPDWRGRPRRRMELTANLAAYRRDEKIEPETMDRRLIAEFAVPEENGWGYFAPVGDTFTLTLDIVDERRRIGRVRVRSLETGRVVGEIAARADGALVKGEVTCLWETPYYAVEGLDKTGRRLFTLAANRGFPDAQVPVVLQGGFQPRRPASILTSGMIECAEVTGPAGDPYNFLKDKPPLGPTVGVSRTCLYRETENDVSIINPVERPDVNLIKRFVPTNPGLPPLSALPLDSSRAVWQQAQAMVSGFAHTDNTFGMNNVEAPPYSRITARWTPELHGHALAILCVPYERVKYTLDFWNALQPAVSKALIPGSEPANPGLFRFGSLAAETANALLAQRPWQSRTGLYPGDVTVFSEHYALEVQDHHEVVRVAPLLQEVTFRLHFNIPPTKLPEGVTGQVVPVKAWSMPAPPVPKPNERIVFGADGTACMWLAKGWEWRVHIDVASLSGYELPDGTITFQVPVMEAITVPLSLTHLQRLTVLTTGPDTSCSARVTLIGPDGRVVAERDSTRSLTDGKKFGQNHVYSAHFDMLPEGRYTVCAYAPKTTSQPAIHPVFRGAEDTISITLWPDESKVKSAEKTPKR